MNKMSLFGVILFLISTSSLAGGVTVRNYSGEPVMVIIGSYEDRGSCFSARTVYDGIWIPKSRYGFSGGYYRCGLRESGRNTRSTAKSIYLKHGESFIEKEAVGSWAGGNMMVWATTVTPGKNGGAGRTWHSGQTIHQNKLTLCVKEAFPKWKSGQFEPSSLLGIKAFHKDHCRAKLPSYFYNRTDQNQYELVLTKENAKNQTYKPVNIRSKN